MTFAIKFTPGARKDLRAIHEYILRAGSEDKAESVVRGIIRAALSLQQLSQRGAIPDELLRSGNKRYRQIFFKPYRILCRVRANVVYVALIVDGRRDMATLLARRLERT